MRITLSNKNPLFSWVTYCPIDEILETIGIHPKLMASAITFGNPSDAVVGNKSTCDVAYKSKTSPLFFQRGE